MLHDSPLASGDLPIDSRDSPEAASMLKIHVERVARFGDRPFVASSPIVVRLQLILATRQRAAKTREQVAAEERRVSRNRLAERRREKADSSGAGRVLRHTHPLAASANEIA